ncbi:hypothetical protein ACFVDQ_37205 [Streptomyces sp. NPDC057684]|uniref:hypothetical protein n=1 Tax=unclassified Streptomyces TaxID=2593676 RepID=UPI00368932CC
MARRVAGWLPLCVPPNYVEIDGHIAQRSLLDRLAHEAGRAPQGIDTVFRGNIDAGTGVPQVANTIRLVHQRKGIDHFAVDPMDAVETVDKAIDHARDVLDLMAQG